MEACGVTPSIPISSTITQPFQKTAPEWRMIKTRVKSPALLQRLMTVPPAIAHGRSDGFITAATGSRQKECASWSFKITCGGTLFWLKRNVQRLLLGPPFSLPIHQTNLARWRVAVDTRQAIDWGPSPDDPHTSRACMDLPGHRLTLHQLRGSIKTTVAG